MSGELRYVDGDAYRVYIYDAVVIGSGCAGLNTADWLYSFGVKNVAIVTEGLKMGTSRNTGSDKQTYYKLSLSGEADSVREMAEDLFAGIGVHGDIALAEAANSVRCFMKLVNLGVAFPTDDYGQYVGYQTDHDNRQRASSAGPLTSHFMTEVLEKAVIQKGITILDGLTAIQLLKMDGEICGLICANRDGDLTVICAGCVILATGGPAACYFDSVYPKSQTGMSGIALLAGAQAQNLEEWQYGLASVKFRWNVSGTYQQVLPRYISVDPDGNEYEFLLSYVSTPKEALNLVFLKGYQWPFDSEKLTGSSLVDMIVYHERAVLGKRVYMDFSKNPTGLEEGFDDLSPEAYDYLKRSDALFGTPIERLQKMNPDAIDLFRKHGIDLYTEPLEVAVCAQHHNGGIAVDQNWQSTVPNLYVVGEAAGTFGLRRPGGSALNSTQVGSLRAAEHIAFVLRPHAAWSQKLRLEADKAIQRIFEQVKSSCQNPQGEECVPLCRRLQHRMSDCAAHLRDVDRIREFRRELLALSEQYFDRVRIEDSKQTIQLYKVRDVIITQMAILSAMEEQAYVFGTRGGAVVLAQQGEPMPSPLEQYKILSSQQKNENLCLLTVLASEGFVSSFHPVRPMPTPHDWFETVWADYRKTHGRGVLKENKI